MLDLAMTLCAFDMIFVLEELIRAFSSINDVLTSGRPCFIYIECSKEGSG